MLNSAPFLFSIKELLLASDGHEWYAAFRANAPSVSVRICVGYLVFVPCLAPGTWYPGVKYGCILCVCALFFRGLLGFLCHCLVSFLLLYLHMPHSPRVPWPCVLGLLLTARTYPGHSGAHICHCHNITIVMCARRRIPNPHHPVTHLCLAR